MLLWLSWKAYGTRGPLPIDRSITQYFAEIQSPIGEKLFGTIARLSSSVVMTIIAIALSVLFISTGRWRGLLALGIAIAGTQVTIHVGKWLIERPRPGPVPDLFSSSSYPSAHAASTMVIWGMLGFVAASNLSGVSRFGSSCAIGLVIVSIATSLVARNVHYPSDVAAGLMIGALWLIMGVAVLQRPNWLF